MYTDITLIAHAIWARKFKAKANISSRKLFLAGQKIAGNSGLDMLLHYITQNKIFSFPKHLPTQAGSCTWQAKAQLMPLCNPAAWISSYSLAHLPHSFSLQGLISLPSTQEKSNSFFFKSDFIPTKAWVAHATALLCAGGGKATRDPRSQLGGTLKLQGYLSQIQRRKIYAGTQELQGPAFPISAHHTCHSRQATSSCLHTGNPKHPFSIKDGPS